RAADGDAGLRGAMREMLNEITRGGRAGRSAAAMLAVLALGAVVCGLSACSGSGSSGLDISPSNESVAISQAIDGDQCVPFGGETFCASGVPAETDNFEGAAVVIEAPSEPLVCTGNNSLTKDCAAELAFTTEGFTRPNSLLAAIADDERGPWKLVPLEVTEDVEGPRTVTITVPGRAEDDGVKPLLAAVLVFPGISPPTDAPQTAEHLRDFGAELVYVSPRLVI